MWGGNNCSHLASGGVGRGREKEGAVQGVEERRERCRAWRYLPPRSAPPPARTMRGYHGPADAVNSPVQCGRTDPLGRVTAVSARSGRAGPLIFLKSCPENRQRRAALI